MFAELLPLQDSRAAVGQRLQFEGPCLLSADWVLVEKGHGARARRAPCKAGLSLVDRHQTNLDRNCQVAAATCHLQFVTITGMGQPVAQLGERELRGRFAVHG